MKTTDEKREVVPSFNDLVFENRNKEYGAYTLRKKYDAALMWSILVSVFFISATVITPFIIEKEHPYTTNTPKDPNVVIFNGMDTPPIEIPKDKLPTPEPIKTKQLIYVAPKVVDSAINDDSNKFLDIDAIKALVNKDSITDLRVEPPKIEIDPEPNNKINDEFTVTEKPYFGIRGDIEFRGWISNNIKYPEEAVQTNTQGRVYLVFVIERDGSISNIQVERSIDPVLSKEALRVLELSPKWNPGKINGTPVRVKIHFPITFTLK